MGSTLGDAKNYVVRLHRAVDEARAPIEAEHAERLRCKRGCSGCCVDGLTVFEVEAALIESRHGALLAEAEPHPPGACAFLDEDGACRIYDERPYVCRTQGLPLRWLEEAEDGAIVEVRDICPLNVDGGPALDELGAERFWSIGPFEERLAAVQASVEDQTEPTRRVALRSLFAKAR
jgi:hypothetical protein